MIKQKKKANLHRLKGNLCTKYLLPSIEIDTQGATFKLLKDLGFINCYLEDKNYITKVSNSLTLVFSVPDSFKENFMLFIKELEKDVSNYISFYEIDNNVFGVIFKIKDCWKHIITLFKEGKYSEMASYSNVFKIIEGEGIFYAPQYKVIRKDKEYQHSLESRIGVREGYLDDKELDDIPEEKDYVFDYEQIIKEQADAIR